jgi:N-hydroxyarylamine O-acetyltransferase
MDAVDWSAAAAPTHRPLTAPQLAAYLGRIRFSAPAAPADATLLHALVRAHSLHIPFESLDVTLRVPISIAPAAVFAKLVERRRGGYCLENTFLLLAALQALGFECRLRSARVWMRFSGLYDPRDPPGPRTHVTMLVRAAGGDGGGAAGDEFLVDVGFGGGGPAAPLPLRAGAVAAVAGDVFRVDAGDAAAGEDAWILWGVHGGVWKRLFSFDHTSWDAPATHASDFITTNFFMSSARGAIFSTLRIASLPLAGGGRISLTNNTLRRRGEEREGVPADVVVDDVPDAATYRALAAEHFGLELTEVDARVIFDASLG